MKLTRATIPMCPECASAMVGPMHKGDYSYACNQCDHVQDYPPDDWGYYAPDVEGVVGEINEILLDKPNQIRPQVHCILLRDWADRLEGKK